MADSVKTTETSDFTQSTKPFALFEAWFADATATEISDPNAMALSTVDSNGLPNVRIVLLKGLDETDNADRGFIFYTNTTSTKGRELLQHPLAAIVFHWKSLGRQVRVRGTTALVHPDEADAYYDTRPRGSRIGAWASDQSKPLASRAQLEQQVEALERSYAQGPIPRPPHWSGFRLLPLEIEFWHDRPFRLHDRIVFVRPDPTAPWTITRLYP